MHAPGIPRAQTSARSEGPFEVMTQRGGRSLDRVNDAARAERKYSQDAMRPLFDGLLEYDQLCQNVLDDFRAGNGGQSMMAEALEKGIDSVENPPASLVALFNQLDNVPDWVDWEQLRRGAIAYWRPGPLVSFVFTSAAIIGGDRSYGVTRPQMFTGRFEKLAYTRSAETFRWLMAATKPEGMRRHNDGFKLTVRVRMLHAVVRASAGASEAWNWDDYGVPICATDMMYSLTYAFTTVMIDAFEKLGVRYSSKEREDIYALWSYIGYVIGVAPSALPVTEAFCRDFTDRWQLIDPGPDDECRRQIHALIELATPEEPVPGQQVSDIYPAIVTRLMPPLRLRAFMYGLVRFLLGDSVGDSVDIPDTGWKHAGHVIRPAVLAFEGLRRVAPGKFNDETIATRALSLFDRVLGARGDEPVIAPAADVLEGLNERAPQLASIHRSRSDATVTTVAAKPR